MINRIMELLILYVVLLSAQGDFLKGIGVRDIIVDRIATVDPTTIADINAKDIDYWFIPSKDLAYTPDSSIIAYERIDKKHGKPVGLWVSDIRNNKEKCLTSQKISSMEWSVDGRYLAFVQYEIAPDNKMGNMSHKPHFNSERLCIYNYTTGQIDSIAFMKGYAIQYKWAPAYNMLAYSYIDNDIGKYVLSVYHAEDHKDYIIDHIIVCDMWNFDWSPDAEMLAYTKPSVMDRLIDEEIPMESEIYLSDINGKNKNQLTKTPEIELFVKWLNNGDHIITEMVQNPREGYTPIYRYLILKKRSKHE